ncbi:hypothetical protein BKA81DRAFT_375364 [Phyllosticta paracitricarpa]
MRMRKTGAVSTWPRRWNKSCPSHRTRATRQPNPTRPSPAPVTSTNSRPPPNTYLDAGIHVRHVSASSTQPNAMTTADTLPSTPHPCFGTRLVPGRRRKSFLADLASPHRITSHRIASQPSIHLAVQQPKDHGPEHRDSNTCAGQGPPSQRLRPPFLLSTTVAHGLLQEPHLAASDSIDGHLPASSLLRPCTPRGPPF